MRCARFGPCTRSFATNVAEPTTAARKGRPPATGTSGTNGAEKYVPHIYGLYGHDGLFETISPDGAALGYGVTTVYASSDENLF